MINYMIYGAYAKACIVMGMTKVYNHVSYNHVP